MGTLSDLRTRIADDLKRSDLNTQIDKAINRGIEHYSKKNAFWFNETNGDFTTVDGTERYIFSSISVSDIYEVHELTITRNSTDIFPIQHMLFNELKWRNEAGTSYKSVPEAFTVYGSAFYFTPIPDASYTATVYYRKKYTVLSTDTDTNDFTSNAEDLIESRARWWIYNRILRRYDHATQAKAEELDALQALDAESSALLTARRLTPYEW